MTDKSNVAAMLVFAKSYLAALQEESKYEFKNGIPEVERMAAGLELKLQAIKENEEFDLTQARQAKMNIKFHYMLGFIQIVTALIAQDKRYFKFQDVAHLARDVFPTADAYTIAKQLQWHNIIRDVSIEGPQGDGFYMTFGNYPEWARLDKTLAHEFGL